MKMSGEIRDEFRLQAFHWGQTPQQLLTKPHCDRLPIVKNFCDGVQKFLEYTIKPSDKGDNKKINTISFKSKSFAGDIELIGGSLFDPRSNKLIAMKIGPDSHGLTRCTLVFLADNYLEGTIELSKNIGKSNNPSLLLDLKRKTYSNPYVGLAQWSILDQNISSNFTTAILKKQGIDQIAQGGYYGGAIILTQMFKTPKTIILNHHSSTVTCIKVDKEEKLAITGSSNGCCIIYCISDDLTWTPQCFLFDHENAITFIDISNDMQLFLTCSIDGTANLYTKSIHPKFVRVFRHKIGFPIHYVNYFFIFIGLIESKSFTMCCFI